MSWQGAPKGERGFTLVEVMIVMILMGIVLAIATTSWFGVVRSRNVDSATNQVAADLRLTHSQATNRLAEYRFVIPANNSSTYQIGPTGALVTKPLPDGTQIAAANTFVFNANGSAAISDTTTSAYPIVVKSAVEPTKNHKVAVTAATSEIKVVP